MATPQFILDLRERIGHDPLWLPGVTAVVIDESRRILLVRRADNGRWTLVTGCLDPGEQPAAGAVREVFEETAVEVRAERILRVESLPPSVYPNGDRAQFLDIALLCRPITTEARVNDDESVEVGWFALDRLPGLTARETSCIEAAVDGTAAWFDDRAPACP